MPPAGLTAPGTFVELATKVAEEHQDRVSEIARYLQTRSSIRALQKETRETTERLEKFLRKPDDEDNRVVPEMHHYKRELEEIEGMHTQAAEKPEFLEELNMHYQQLLKQYENCLGFTLKLVGKMPLRTQRLFLDQLNQQSLISLENQLDATISRLDSKELSPKEAETKSYLQEMLKGVGRAKQQKQEAEGTTEELARHGQVFLRAPRTPKITLPGLPARGETEEE